jgi:MFS family permease
VRETVYKNYLITLLTVVLAFSSVDRLALALVLQDIKADLLLSDTQLGVLTGVAFAIFYSIMGLPIARWADRGNRVFVISITTALWSVAVALCAAAGSYVQLLLIRIGVAVGEAGCMPVANSLIADSFSRAERPRVVARYLLGGPLSAIIAYSVGGWLNEYYGWRVMFIVLGAPGVLLGAVAWLTLREPRHSDERALPAASRAMSGPAPPLMEVCVTLWQLPTFRHLLLGHAVMVFAQAGAAQWQPAFFIRTYGLGTGALGTWLGAVYAAAGLFGTLLGGELTTRYAANNERLQLEWSAATYLCAGIIWSLVYLSPNQYVAFGLIGLALVSTALSNGAYFALIQTLVPPRMCAQAIALIFLSNNLIGLGLGPLAVGALSDMLQPAAGNQSLRYVLLMLCPICLWAAWHIRRAGRTVVADLRAGSAARARTLSPATVPAPGCE